MIDKPYISPHYQGFFAGRDEGIVSAGGKAARKPIVVLDALTITVVSVCWSLDNGHYLVRSIEPDREYLLLARDTQRGYEPYCYDWIRPSTALGGDEQAALWQSWL